MSPKALGGGTHSEKPHPGQVRAARQPSSSRANHQQLNAFRKARYPLTIIKDYLESFNVESMTYDT